MLWTNGPHKAHLFVDFEGQDFHTIITREEDDHRLHSVRYTCAPFTDAVYPSSMPPVLYQHGNKLQLLLLQGPAGLAKQL